MWQSPVFIGMRNSVTSKKPGYPGSLLLASRMHVMLFQINYVLFNLRALVPTFQSGHIRRYESFFC